MAEIERLREEYVTGIKTNEEVKKALESERGKNRDRSRASDGVLELRLQLDESLQKKKTFSDSFTRAPDPRTKLTDWGTIYKMLPKWMNR